VNALAVPSQKDTVWSSMDGVTYNKSKSSILLVRESYGRIFNYFNYLFKTNVIKIVVLPSGKMYVYIKSIDTVIRVCFYFSGYDVQPGDSDGP